MSTENKIMNGVHPNQLYGSPAISSNASEASAASDKLTLSGFEGPEKLLEIWFPGQVSAERAGLRSVDRFVWENMLKIVQCRVLSVIRNEFCDAYLLSESSMFVYNNRLMLKTCGTTTLLHAVPEILRIATTIGLAKIESFFYSRKSFLYPERQEWPHGKWGDEVAYLDDIFPSNQFDTSGYVLGKINGDHWCLYTCSPGGLDSDGNPVLVNDVDEVQSPGECDDDVTLEIMMTELDPERMKKFWRTPQEQEQALLGHNVNALKHKFTGAEHRVFTETGISKIYPGSIVDDYVFDPCGYSLNGLLDEYYYTIHVTPESICSYASFETTVPIKALKEGMDYSAFSEVIDKVLQVFNPGKFSTTLFVRESGTHHFKGTNGPITNYKRRDAVVQCLGKWQLHFSHYDKGSDRPA
ncbi:S-adenosylmethionine decarboxylase proenzyme [Gorgonomyces haynaldii]|nr:S-adenosylmethionine decarboxylase proenzyme [Gorgonomyces haynaldii]